MCETMYHEELIPCPFCKGKEINMGTKSINGVILQAVGTCVSCGAVGPYEDTEEEAKESWNKRGAK